MSGQLVSQANGRNKLCTGVDDSSSVGGNVRRGRLKRFNVGIMSPRTPASIRKSSRVQFDIFFPPFYALSTKLRQCSIHALDGASFPSHRFKDSFLDDAAFFWRSQ